MDEILKRMRGMTFTLEDIEVMFHFMICRIDPNIELNSQKFKNIRDAFNHQNNEIEAKK